MSTKNFLVSLLCLLCLLCSPALAQNTGPGAGVSVAAGQNVTTSTNGRVVTVNSTGGGISIAPGLNVTTVTNGNVVTVSATGGATNVVAYTRIYYPGWQCTDYKAINPGQGGTNVLLGSYTGPGMITELQSAWDAPNLTNFQTMVYVINIDGLYTLRMTNGTLFNCWCNPYGEWSAYSSYVGADGGYVGDRVFPGGIPFYSSCTVSQYLPPDSGSYSMFDDTYVTIGPFPQSTNVNYYFQWTETSLGISAGNLNCLNVSSPGGGRLMDICALIAGSGQNINEVRFIIDRDGTNSFLANGFENQVADVDYFNFGATPRVHKGNNFATCQQGFYSPGGWNGYGNYVAYPALTGEYLVFEGQQPVFFTNTLQVILPATNTLTNIVGLSWYSNATPPFQVVGGGSSDDNGQFFFSDLLGIYWPVASPGFPIHTGVDTWDGLYTGSTSNLVNVSNNISAGSISTKTNAVIGGALVVNGSMVAKNGLSINGGIIMDGNFGDNMYLPQSSSVAWESLVSANTYVNSWSMVGYFATGGINQLLLQNQTTNCQFLITDLVNSHGITNGSIGFNFSPQGSTTTLQYLFSGTGCSLPVQTTVAGLVSASNFVSVVKLITNSYSITTNDAVLVCYGTNQLVTLNVAIPGFTVTVQCKGYGASVIITNTTAGTTFTVPGLGITTNAVYLGACNTPSNSWTGVYDGANW